MAKIVSISTALPAHRHTQENILQFMQNAYAAEGKDKRILSYLYRHSGIDARYSVIADYTLPMEEWEFFPRSGSLEPFPALEHRMKWFRMHAPALSMQAAEKCIAGYAQKEELTHLITVSCTGMSAPGLELLLIEAMGLPNDISRSAINFMGCYAAIHGLKQARDIVQSQPDAKVLLVCTELCTLHFQKTFTDDTITSPILFGDGAAAVLITGDESRDKGIKLQSFYAEVLKDAKDAMSWSISSNGFIMTLSAEVPELFRHDILSLKKNAFEKAGVGDNDVRYFCIHPGGKRILQGIGAGLSLSSEALAYSYRVLKQYGNMSSPTILFVLKEMWDDLMQDTGAHIFGAAFGPGLTMESMLMMAV